MIKPDQDDVVLTEKCGCYVHEGYNAGDSDYIVHCDIHDAAPELLAELRGFVENAIHNPKAASNQMDYYSGRFQAAISKAEGRG